MVLILLSFTHLFVRLVACLDGCFELVCSFICIAALPHWSDVLKELLVSLNHCSIHFEMLSRNLQ